MKSAISLQIANLYAQYAAQFACGERASNQMTMQAFVEQLAKQGVLLDTLNWQEWYQNAHLVDKPDYIREASLYQCRLLLTAMSRLERFSRGVLENMRRQGVLLAILERLNVLSHPEGNLGFGNATA
ncbi:DUF6508 domain-containing protein [Shewanella aquimarina]|uniref:DUF6508 domain-containing protein n=1 Tax=Shewanella aquimarina TaxID=260365 RepID=UPI002014A96E|nr:DUF6508 domain-containing protein [Shewanella aquimarina]MCL2909259.1 DUF6508 domain-containing protein [Shewanella aquimarina]